VSKHGVDRFDTEAEYRAMVLLAYHDSICPDHEECDMRATHASQLNGNFPVLKSFLTRLSELETETALDAV